MQAFKVDAKTGRNAGAEVVHQHVGFAHQPHQYCALVGLLEIQHHPALGTVHPQERAAFGFQRGRVLAQIVANRWLHLDHFRALVGQQGAAVRAGDIGAQVQYAHAAERAAGTIAPGDVERRWVVAC